MSEEQKTVLIIDDDQTMIDLFSSWLINVGYVVHSAFDGREGVTQAKATAYDLVVTDLMMPEESGVDVIRELRSDVKTKNIPILIVSGVLEEDSLECGVNIEGQFYPALKKPLNRGATVTLVKELLKDS